MFFFHLADVNSDQNPMDIADLASSHCDRELLHAIQHRNYKLIRELSELLRRIKEGSFGICDECSGFIDIERLRAALAMLSIAMLSHKIMPSRKSKVTKQTHC